MVQKFGHRIPRWYTTLYTIIVSIFWLHNNLHKRTRLYFFFRNKTPTNLHNARIKKVTTIPPKEYK